MKQGKVRVSQIFNISKHFKEVSFSTWLLTYVEPVAVTNVKARYIFNSDYNYNHKRLMC